MMRGWKTWIAAGCLRVLAAIDLYDGATEAGLAKLSAALGMIGLGHKIEKTGSCGGQS